MKLITSILLLSLIWIAPLDVQAESHSPSPTVHIALKWQDMELLQPAVPMEWNKKTMLEKQSQGRLLRVQIIPYKLSGERARFDVQINAEQDGKLIESARPRVIVMNREPAAIEVGQESGTGYRLELRASF